MKMPYIKNIDAKNIVYILLLAFFGCFILLSLPKFVKMSEGMENMTEGGAAGVSIPVAQTFSF